MNLKPNFKKLSLVLAIAFVLVLAAAWVQQHNVEAQSKKQFKGAKVQNNQLIPDAGLKLRLVSNSLIEVIKEETTTTGSGPTARRVTRPVKVNGINVSCVCGGTTNTTNCSTIVSSGGAICKTKNNSCSRCDMIATEN